MNKDIDFKKLDDISLMECISTTNNDTAYNEFVARFYETVKTQCTIKCKQRKLDPHVGEQIAHQTFERVKKYKSFNKAKLNGNDPKKAITGWLYRILNNQFYDYYNSSKKSEEPITTYFDDLAVEFAETNPNKLLDLKEFAESVFSKLNKKEKEVVLTDIEYKKGRKYLPSDINESLATRIGVKTNSIRKIRERAIVKIKLAIDEFNR